MTPENMLQLDKFLPYRLSITSNMVSDVIAGAYAKLFALNVAEWRIIAVIAETDSITQNDICARTLMDKVTISRAAISLSGRGLLIRTPNPRDGRSNMLSLSEDGRALYANVVPKALELEARIFGDMEKRDIEQFATMLKRVFDAAKALTDEA